MKVSFLVLSALAASLFCSCKALKKITSPGEYDPVYLHESSALDTPGAEAARAAKRGELEQEGSYAPGEELEVQQGRVFLFTRNPEQNPDAGGKMVETAKAKIISCQGLYYFVETDNGAKGFLRESDLVNPVNLVSTTAAAGLPGLPDGETPGPEGWGDGVTQPETIQLDSNQTLMTNESGRTVVVVKKEGDGNSEFEARKKALEEGKSMPKAETAAKPADDKAQPASEPLPDPASEPLPEPAGGGN